MIHTKRIALAALTLFALAGAAPASAQFLPPVFPGPYGYDQQDEYQPRYRREYRREYRPRYEQPYYQPRREAGYTCATRRGSCEISDGQPVGSICKCYIEGFGRKRGYTQP